MTVLVGLAEHPLSRRLSTTNFRRRTLDASRINIFERWESYAAVEAFRADGPDDDQSAAIVSASVSEYEVADVRSLFG